MKRIIFLMVASFLVNNCYGITLLSSTSDVACAEILPRAQSLFKDSLNEASSLEKKETLITSFFDFLENEADTIVNNLKTAFNILNIQTLRYSPYLALQQIIVQKAKSLFETNSQELPHYFNCLKNYFNSQLKELQESP